MQKKFITASFILLLISSSGFNFIYPRNINSTSYSFNIQDSILYQDDFNQEGLNDWVVIDESNNIKSNWYLEDGYLIQDTDVGSRSNLSGSIFLYNKMNFENYVLKTNVVYTDDDYIGLIFKYIDENNYHRFILSSQSQTIRLDKKVNGETIIVKELKNNEWHECKFSITLFVNSDSIVVYLDYTKIISAVNENPQSGKIGLVSIANLGSFFDDITLFSRYQITQPEEILGITRGPYLQNLLGDSVTIMWRTDKTSNSVVEYYSDKKNVSVLFIKDSTIVHEVKLKNLLPFTKYYYRVKCDSTASEWFTFTTPKLNTDEFSFILYGDNQLNFLRHKEITNQFKNHKFDFIISCGDVVQRGPRNDWDTEFFTPLKEILINKPIYCAIGNHELNSPNYYFNFSTPAPDHENYYSFSYSNSFFIFLDNPLAAYPDKTFFTDFKPGSNQYAWLEKQLSSNEAQKADWLFVISHVPSYVLDRKDIYSDSEKYLVPLFEKYKVDFSFSGHLHGYDRGNVNGVNYLVSAGGGGALNKPGSGKLKSNKRFKIIYNYSYVTVKNKTITLQTFDVSGNQIDYLQLKKQ